MNVHCRNRMANREEKYRTMLCEGEVEERKTNRKNMLISPSQATLKKKSRSVSQQKYHPLERTAIENQSVSKK